MSGCSAMVDIAKSAFANKELHQIAKSAIKPTDTINILASGR